jgi:hypothetical protein
VRKAVRSLWNGGDRLLIYLSSAHAPWLIVPTTPSSGSPSRRTSVRRAAGGANSIGASGPRVRLIENPGAVAQMGSSFNRPRMSAPTPRIYCYPQ